MSLPGRPEYAAIADFIHDAGTQLDPLAQAER
jgi:hypothetical protein